MVSPMTSDGRLSNEELHDRAQYYDDWAADIRRLNGTSVDADYAAETAFVLRSLATLQRSAEVMRLALNYALPIVEKYAHTQGDNAAFHAKITAPIRAALGALPPQQDAKDGATG
jgi:hypothetical protein